MDFARFAEMHGLIINSLVIGRWVRVPTLDKPSKKNGSYIWDGVMGAVRNWAVHDKAVVYYSEEPYRPDPLADARREKQKQERLERQAKAKARAIEMINLSRMKRHPYLERKGFETKGNVLEGMLIIPMKINNLVVGCQTIQPDGTKRFLTGQITKGASFRIGWRGKDIVCEGYATGLSVHRALKFLNKEAKIHVCFSASNMVEVAKGLKDPLVIADNDASETGLRMAKKIGHRYWMSDKVGEDFNDAELRLGTPSVSHSLKNLMT